MEKTIVIFLGVPVLVFLFFILMRSLLPKNIDSNRVDWKHIIKLLSIQMLIGITGIGISIKMAGLVGYLYALLILVIAALIFNVCYGIWYFRQLIKLTQETGHS